MLGCAADPALESPDRRRGAAQRLFTLYDLPVTAGGQTGWYRSCSAATCNITPIERLRCLPADRGTVVQSAELRRRPRAGLWTRQASRRTPHQSLRTASSAPGHDHLRRQRLQSARHPGRHQRHRHRSPEPPATISSTAPLAATRSMAAWAADTAVSLAAVRRPLAACSPTAPAWYRRRASAPTGPTR